MLNSSAVTIVAASALRRERLSELVKACSDRASVEVVAVPNFSAEKLQQIAPDVLVADLETHSAASAMLRSISALVSPVGAVALVDNPERRWVSSALKAGVNAIISRAPDDEEIKLALEAAGAGLVLLHPSSARMLIEASLPAMDETGEMEHLTAREHQVLRLMGEGLGNKEIAARLGISDHTAKFHISSILAKLGAGSRTEAVRQGIRRGLIPI